MPEGPESFSKVFFGSMLLRIGLAVAAIALSYAGAEIGDATGAEWGPFVGGVLGLAVGILLVVLVLRRTPNR